MRGHVLVILVLAGCVGQGSGSEKAAGAPAAYLSNEEFNELLIEIDYHEATPPSEFAMEALLSTLREITGKVDVRLLPPKPTTGLARDSWTDDTLIEAASRSLDEAPNGLYGKNRVAVLHILYVKGVYDHPTNGGALGLGFENFAVLFREEKLVSPPRLVEPSFGQLMERSILIHEVGHVIGLVDNGLSMVKPHSDPESPAHSASRESVMYRGVDGGRALVGTIDESEAPPHRFDADDLADIRAFQASRSS